MDKLNSSASFYNELRDRKDGNAKVAKTLPGYFSMWFLEKWFTWLSNKDIVKYWIDQWYITHWWSAKDVASKLWELDNDMWDLLMKVVKYNIKKKRWKWGKAFSLTGNTIDWLEYSYQKNPRKYLEAIYKKLGEFKLKDYINIPTKEEFEKMIQEWKIKFPENEKDELWNNFVRTNPKGETDRNKKYSPDLRVRPLKD